MTTVVSPPPAQGPPTVAPPPTQRPTATHEPKPAETGVWVAIATISMSFAALTSAMVVRQSGAADWRHFQLPSILYVNTLILLISSVTIESWRRRITAAPGQAATQVPPRRLAGLYLTLTLGLLFVMGQVVAWTNLAAQGLFLATSPSSAFFYVFTALHGLHVLGGLAGLLYVRHRLRRPAGLVPTTALGAAALYWHFMAALWLYLLALLRFRV
jgi:cytochrome c oxidase subunit 3